MPAPTPILGVTGGPPTSPGRLPVLVESGGSGGSIGGLQPNPIRGISIAFGSAWNAEAPLWQDITRMGTP